MSGGILLSLVKLLAFCLLTSSSTVQCQNSNEQSISTSVAGMEKLLDTEKNLIDAVENYIGQLQAKVETLKNLLNELKTENQKGFNNAEQYLYNPLNGYALVRRMHYDWPHIELFMAKPVGESYLQVIQKYRQEMPTSNDLSEASEAIYRLQKTYDMKANDMAKGILYGKQYDVNLKTIDRYFMGHHLFGQEEYYHAGFWIYTAIESYQTSDYNTIVDFGQEKMFTLYAEALMQQNRPNDALIMIQKAVALYPQDGALARRKMEIELASKTNREAAKGHPVPVATSYELGCRGAFSDKPSHFHCLYNRTTSAFLHLAPLKMEIIALQPYLVLFHDVISDSEIEHLKGLAKPNLKRATVYSEDAQKSKVIGRRTSKFAWFPDDFTNITLRINQRIRDMTGFDISGSEMLQVMNYGLGGHYDTHYDFFNVSETAEVVRANGDRISTVLFYLTDVEQGGATVFPNIHTAVFPRKGSAVMWYNLDNKVEADWRTLHAACPVIVGSKWVCNKWIRAKAQEFKRPCYA